MKKDDLRQMFPAGVLGLLDSESQLSCAFAIDQIVDSRAPLVESEKMLVLFKCLLVVFTHVYNALI